MSRNVDEFRSSTDSLEHDLVKWINGYLYWRIRDIYCAPNRQQRMSLNEEISDNGKTYLDLLSESGFISINLNNLNEHIKLLQQQEEREIASQIEAWIELDPQQKLQTCYHRNRDRYHCQILSYRLIIKDPPDSFTQIAQDLDIPYQTLVSHWKRSLPLLQAQSQIFGYESTRDT